MKSRVQLAIIGAGPYGLSLAAHMTAAGVEHRIFGVPMQFWSQVAKAGDRRYLKSYCFGTNLSAPTRGASFVDYNGPRGLETFEPCSMANFADYGRWFQSLHVPWLEQTDVVSLARAGNGFELGLANGERATANAVVIATGLSSFQRRPDLAPESPLFTHTAAIDDFASYRGKEVAVVGAGQSALEAAALLHEAGAMPHLIVRGDRVRWSTRIAPQSRTPWQKLRSPISVLGTGPKSWLLAHYPGAMHGLPGNLRQRFAKTYLPPEGAWWLRDRVEGTVPIQLSSVIGSASESNGRVHLRLRNVKTGDESTLRCDQVIFGTGYAVDIKRIPFIDPGLCAAITCTNGAPRLNARFESSVPGLHFLGAASVPSFGPLFRFVAGADYAAKVLTRHLAKAATRHAPAGALDALVSRPT